jgi:hypothetical protein
VATCFGCLHRWELVETRRSTAFAIACHYAHTSACDHYPATDVTDVGRFVHVQHPHHVLYLRRKEFDDLPVSGNIGKVMAAVERLPPDFIDELAAMAMLVGEDDAAMEAFVASKVAGWAGRYHR